jgi:DNA-binding NarL/FixJ family response regulator
MLAKMIASLGHIVIGEAANGEQALVEYTQLKPDVMTMDLAMGGSDGAQATTEIISAFPEARIIVISAQQDRSVIVDALERGARHFIVKPVSQEKLSAVLDNVLLQTFDRQKHLEFVRTLKESLEPQGQKPATPSHNNLPARVLIVDDSAVARKSLREIVSSLGYNVVGEAANGAQAFVEYTKLKPDIVTMDLTMQGLGGAEATSKIIAADPHARIVVISAMETRQGIIDALERGARHFIVKPIQKDKIAAALKNVMEQDFDLDKHKDRVRQLKKAENSLYLNDTAEAILPPYAINVQDNNLVYVVISQCITKTSFLSLVMELEEHLSGSPRVLFDFGPMIRLDEELIIGLSELIKNIENSFGKVKAISNNKRFVDCVSEAQLGNTANLLADALQYIEN